MSAYACLICGAEEPCQCVYPTGGRCCNCNDIVPSDVEDAYCPECRDHHPEWPGALNRVPDFLASRAHLALDRTVPVYPVHVPYTGRWRMWICVSDGETQGEPGMLALVEKKGRAYVMEVRILPGQSFICASLEDARQTAWKLWQPGMVDLPDEDDAEHESLVAVSRG